MTNAAADTKLARRLQKRNVWPSYTKCLRVVQDRIRCCPDETRVQLQAAIDAGELDPAGGVAHADTRGKVP